MRRPQTLLLGFLALWLSSTLLMASARAADIAYVYDESGRLIAAVDPAGENAVYSYDSVGNLLSISRQSSAHRSR